ncbi:hypothetical protein WMW72_32275 [Paenibacillus filicis]|uniref:Uncharacterized protein n=1 Tax=Paenibacillus filicis TaxID=669464 RepID=A0ABU9DWG0_9BACL
MAWTGWSLLVVGILYVPSLPWYILGQVQEAEIRIWGLSAISGGALALTGRLAYMRSPEGVRRWLLLVGIVGMLVIGLAQVPALFSWLLYGGVFTGEWMPSERAGFVIGMGLHLWLTALAAGTIVSAIVALSGRLRKGLKLPGKQLAQFVALLLAIAGGWWGWELYQSSRWVAFTYPEHGAVDVPLNAQVNVVFSGTHSSMGMRIRYVEQPERVVPGMTGGGPSGMTFEPEGGFAPGSRVQVIVDAGRRSHTFEFTTASGAP